MIRCKMSSGWCLLSDQLFLSLSVLPQALAPLLPGTVQALHLLICHLVQVTQHPRHPLCRQWDQRLAMAQATPRIRQGLAQQHMDSSLAVISAKPGVWLKVVHNLGSKEQQALLMPRKLDPALKSVFRCLSFVTFKQSDSFWSAACCEKILCPISKAHHASE